MSALHTAGATNEGPAPRTLQSFEPATGALLGEVPIASPADVARTVARTKKAQSAWSILPVEERCAGS